MAEQHGRVAVPVFDRAVLERLFGADADMVSSVLRTYCDSMATALAELRVATGAGALAEVAAIAHRIKGASRMSGAIALGAGADRLEQLANAADAVGACACLLQVEDDWGELLLQLGAAGVSP